MFSLSLLLLFPRQLHKVLASVYSCYPTNKLTASSEVFFTQEADNTEYVDQLIHLVLQINRLSFSTGWGKEVGPTFGKFCTCFLTTFVSATLKTCNTGPTF